MFLPCTAAVHGCSWIIPDMHLLAPLPGVQHMKWPIFGMWGTCEQSAQTEGSESTSHLPVVLTDLHITTIFMPSLCSFHVASSITCFLDCGMSWYPDLHLIKQLSAWSGPRGKQRENQLCSMKTAWIHPFVSPHMDCWAWVILNLKRVKLICQPTCCLRVNRLIKTEG